MNRLAPLLSVILVLFGSGCMSVKTADQHLQTFLTTMPATGVGEVKQYFVCPFWVETAYAKDIATRPDGHLHVGVARLTFVSWLFFGRVSVENFMRPPVIPPPVPPKQFYLQRERYAIPRDPMTAK